MSQLAERVLEPARRTSHFVEILGRGDPDLPADQELQVSRGLIGLVDPVRVFRTAKRVELGTELRKIAPATGLLRDLAHGRDRDGVMENPPVDDRGGARVEREPASFLAGRECTEVDAPPVLRLRWNDGREVLVGPRIGDRRLCDQAEVVAQRHAASLVLVLSARHRHAIALFAPLGPTYDRVARLLSFGQDPRWRRFLAARLDVGPRDTVLDVATGTGAVAVELNRRTGCAVVGIDQSAEMLAEARRRTGSRIELVQGDAERLPFPDASFDGLTVTYLLRYVDDPGATLRELARVVRPGRTIASLEFGVPADAVAHACWQLYVRVGLPWLGRLISPSWAEVGRFLGPSIEQFWAAYPLEQQLVLWRTAGIENVVYHTMSLGGGIVIWGTRA
jgi:demethylmenaquinone methyltransferase / 2-methoxy-6-polyprenyl-1,4-benzoquinol methylase